MVIKMSSNSKTVWQEQKGNCNQADIRCACASAQATSRFCKVLGQNQTHLFMQ